MFTIHVPEQISKRVPSRLKKFLTIRLNFITIHYIWIFSCAIVTSVMVYPILNMRYIDSLFFACGSATQSGLNTLDFNKLVTYQQTVLMLMAWVTNPIAINTAVVFVRLYWFEKRFKDIVAETKSKMSDRHSVSRRKGEDEEDKLERGVGDRPIRVLHPNSKLHLVDGPDGMRMAPQAQPRPETPPLSPTAIHFNIPDSPRMHRNQLHHLPPMHSPQSTRKRSLSDGAPTTPHAATFFGRGKHSQQENGATKEDSKQDESAIVDDNDDEGEDKPTNDGNANNDPHIKIVENQRRTRHDSVALRIPSPREFEAGGKIRANIDEELRRKSNEDVEDEDFDGHDQQTKPVKRAITIDEPEHRPHEAGSKIRMRNMSARHTLDRVMPGSATFDRALSTFKRRTPSQATEKTTMTMPYLSYTPTVGRNSAFANLTDEQRDELGGIEYRSLKTLAVILLGYFFFFQIFGMISLVPWILNSRHFGAIVDGVGQGRTWWGIFTASSSFTDLGFTLNPDSMASFNTATWPLIVMSYLIIIGNTGFPCMLRFVIWSLWKLCPESSRYKEELHFLLDHPRRCFTLLFPSKATWVLFGILVLLNGVDVLLFIVLDLNDDTVTSIPVGYRILDAWFQAASTRTAGFAVINLSALHPAVQVSYLVMMYISVFPIAISVRRTNVYEERSLGIYGTKEDEAEDEQEPSFIAAHLRRQLSFDLWYVFLGMFLICIAEGGRIENSTDYAFTQFSILFEVVSAYGTVGLSLGYPDVNTSFSGQFCTFSKLVIIAMMIRGRHRGLPYELDRAIRLPSEHENLKEEEDAKRRITRRLSQISLAPGERPTFFMHHPATMPAGLHFDRGEHDLGTSTAVSNGIAPVHSRSGNSYQNHENGQVNVHGYDIDTDRTSSNSA